MSTERVRALRGVCIGVEQHLKPLDVAEVDASTAQFLVSIGAVERFPEAPTTPDESMPAPDESTPKPSTKPAKAGAKE